MRLSIALNYSIALGLMGTSAAFTPPGAFLRQSVKLSVGNFGRSGTAWENDDFLDSLSNPKEGEAQQTPQEEPAAGEIADLPSVGAYQGGDEESQGGSRFKAMMEAAASAKSEEAYRGPPPMNPYAPGQPAAAQPAAPAGDPDAMSVEEQAAMFRQMMQVQPPQKGQYDPPPAGKPTQIGGLDDKGRKIGRNRDTDTIANTSDLYFAQLKRDSSVRNMARIEGDEGFADQIWGDSSVKELEVELKTNPYLQKEKDEEAELYRQMAAVQRAAHIKAEAYKPDMNDRGPNFKELMAAKRKAKGGAAAVTPAPTPAPAPVVQAVPVPAPAPAPVVQTPPPAPVVAEIPVPQPVVAPAAPVSAAAAPETEDSKRQARELQGYFLKHRGGPGFGSGKLRGNEVEKFEQTLKAVGGQLRAEAGPRTEQASVPAPAVVAAPAPAAVVAPAAPAPAPVVAASSEESAGRLQGTLACVEGAVQMYKNCPPDLQPGMLMALRGALLSAASSCQQVIEGTDTPTPYTPPAADGAAAAPLESTLAFVEGAVQMYKNCPPEMQAGMLMSVRAALLSAANSCQQVIDQGEEQPVVVAAPAAAAPVVVQDAPTPSIQEDAAPTGNDSNSVLLRKVYDSLGDASGGGKFGLGPISSTESSDLADLVYDMRGVLMEELDSGIPEDEASPVPTITTTTAEPVKKTSSGSTSSKYQDMLAKARAAKKNQN